MDVDRAEAAQGAATGETDLGPARARDERAEDAEGRAHAGHQLPVRTLGGMLGGLHLDRLVLAALNGAPQIPQDPKHRLHVRQARSVLDPQRLASQQGGGQHRQDRVFRPRDVDLALQAATTFHDQLVHLVPPWCS